MLLLTLNLLVAAVFGAGVEPSPDAPLLNFFRGGADGCSWTALDVRQGKERVYLKTPACPKELVWDVEGRRGVYLLEGGVFAFSLDKPSPRPVKLGPAPTPTDVDELFWIDESGEARHAYIDSASVTTEEKGDKTFVTYQGREYLQTYDPGLGEAAMAVVEELKDGAWRRVSVEPTMTGASDTLSVNVVKKAEKAGTFSLASLLNNANEEPHDSPVFKALKLPRSDDGPADPSRFRYYAWGPSHGLLLKTDEDYDMTTGSPLLCRGRCSEPQPLTDIEGSVDLSISSDLALISPPGGGTVFVYGRDSAKPLAKVEGAGAPVWLPPRAVPTAPWARSR